MSDVNLFEEYIPTDKWSLQDWYLSKVVYLDRLFSRLVRASLSGGHDLRSMIDFGAAVISYHNAASQNFEKFMKSDYSEFKRLLPLKRDDLSYDSCFRMMELISMFHWRSGLTKLGESRPIGSFAKARSSVGIGLKEERQDG